MPRFYFDLVNNEKIIDKKGISLPNNDAARDYAKTFARELIEETPDLLGEPHSEWSVHISNGRFERLFQIPFASLVGQRSAPPTEDDSSDDASS